jgi:hypothetical protein
VKDPRIIDKTELTHLEYEVLIDSVNHRPAGLWCKEHFGSRWNPIDNRSGKWSMFYHAGVVPQKYRFCFANEQDMMWFALRWS